MPAEKDFKRLVRARMARTGESYASARRQLAAKQSTGKTASDRFRVVVFDSNPLLRGGFVWALRLELRDVDVVEVAQRDELGAEVREVRPDVVVASDLDDAEVPLLRQAAPNIAVVAVVPPGRRSPAGVDACISFEVGAREFAVCVARAAGRDPDEPAS